MGVVELLLCLVIGRRLAMRPPDGEGVAVGRRPRWRVRMLCVRVCVWGVFVFVELPQRVRPLVCLGEQGCGRGDGSLGLGWMMSVGGRCGGNRGFDEAGRAEMQRGVMACSRVCLFVCGFGVGRLSWFCRVPARSGCH